MIGRARWSASSKKIISVLRWRIASCQRDAFLHAARQLGRHELGDVAPSPTAQALSTRHSSRGTAHAAHMPGEGRLSPPHGSESKSARPWNSRARFAPHVLAPRSPRYRFPPPSILIEPPSGSRGRGSFQHHRFAGCPSRRSRPFFAPRPTSRSSPSGTRFGPKNLRKPLTHIGHRFPRIALCAKTPRVGRIRSQRGSRRRPRQVVFVFRRRRPARRPRE